MLRFSTNLCVSEELTNEKFIDMVFDWLNGSPHYSFENLIWNKQNDYFNKSNDDKQTINISRYDKEDTVAVHLINRDNQVIWTNDYILTTKNKNRILSVQLYSETEKITDKFPKEFNRPYLLKKIITDGFGGLDNGLKICDRFTYIEEDNIELISDIINSKVEYMMPIVYVSTSFFDGKHKVNCSELAKDLAGVAHVLVEKNYRTSQLLKELTGGKNPYNGAIQIYYGKDYSNRIIPSFYKNGNQIRYEISNAVYSRLILGKIDDSLSWNKIQYNHLQLKNKEDKDLIELSENILKDTEENLKNAKLRIEDLEDEVSRLKLKVQSFEYSYNKDENKKTAVFLETQEVDLYEGELNDIVLNLIKQEIDKMCSDPNQKERRKFHVLNSLLQQNAISHNPEQIIENIKNAIGNNNDLTRNQKRALCENGFEIIDGDHYKLTYKGDQRYNFTLAKTSSDYRSKDNFLSKIKNVLFK